MPITGHPDPRLLLPMPMPAREVRPLEMLMCGDHEGRESPAWCYVLSTSEHLPTLPAGTDRQPADPGEGMVEFAMECGRTYRVSGGLMLLVQGLAPDVRWRDLDDAEN